MSTGEGAVRDFAREFMNGTLPSYSVFGGASVSQNEQREAASMEGYVRRHRNATGIITLDDGSRWECQDRGDGAAEWVPTKVGL